jgi:hypothetical protein
MVRTGIRSRRYDIPAEGGWRNQWKMSRPMSRIKEIKLIKEIERKGE